MSSAKLHGHPSLPAPAMHVGFSAHQSKSHVLAGVQDAYWSDDDADDAECPLCLEEMDISDLNFKPCVCGYQICRFCWHHIKQNLNGRSTTDDAVQFKPIPQEDHKRLTQQKKQRERERKELDALGRRHFVNVRVVQRNVVYVVGIGPRFAKEELIPTLRSNEYFGQYGKISKIILVKRTSSGGSPVLGLYITYHRREDAARCIATVDGAPSPGGGREVMRASYGTTKYCMAFLRSLTCSDSTCMSLHEWGDEKDCFTKEDLTTLKHTIKDTENRTRSAKDDAGRLPRGAAWGTKASVPVTSSPTMPSSSVTIVQRSNRRGGQRQARNPNPDSKSSNRSHHDRKPGPAAGNTKTPSVTSLSRPPTPAVACLPRRPATPTDVKILLSPAPSTTIESDLGSGSQDVPPSPARPRSTESVQSSVPSNVLGGPDVPPGFSAPPGLPPPSRKSDLHAPSIQPSQSTYQISTAAQALLDDVKFRRENAPANTTASIFPDLDRTLRMLSREDEFGGFSFNLDPKLAGNNPNTDIALPDLEVETTVPYTGGFIDTFPALRSQQQLPSSKSFTAPPPGISYPQSSSRSVYDPLSMRGTPIDHQSTGCSNYMGTFNPFGESTEESASQSQVAASGKSVLPDEERKVSRFGFARGRQGSTAASSPVHAASPLSASDSHQSFFSAETASPAQPHWNSSSHFDRSYPTSPLAQHAQVVQAPPQQQPRFQPFDTSVGVSEAQLREFLQTSRERANAMQNGAAGRRLLSFHDPAIMSARLASPRLTNGCAPPNVPLGPPPGLGFPPGLPTNHAAPVLHLRSNDDSLIDPSRFNALPNVPQSAPAPTSSPTLSPEDFPALGASTTATGSIATQGDSQAASEIGSTAEGSKGQAKTDRKAAKKVAAAQRALERQKFVQERAAARSAEKARIAQEKAAEKERLAILKEEREKGERERIEREKAEREKAAHEKEEKAKRDLLRSPRQIDTNTEEIPSTTETSAPAIGTGNQTIFSSPSDSRAQSVDRVSPIERASVADLMDEIDARNLYMNLPNHPFFDLHKINPAAKMPLEYAPLVHALSALSVGGGSFATSMPSGSIDNAVSSFQQLLETLTQTISDLLRLLPRTTWDDSSSFDGVLRDMLKGDDFLDETGDDAVGKEDEVAALTQALERRARWMEVQLSKLEELHRDINNAAVRAVLAFNDNGWGCQKSLPRVGNTLRRFDSIGFIEENGQMRPMTVEELEKKLVVAKEAAVFAETELREAMEKVQAVRPLEVDDY
ncbi:hypothetical protein F5J12DRAFT_905003 [Pisolithus orientalis]|uniref:uncharacterized protein n=1 Tax=Pisolithus orientalis TaxID=936130 RepID=UPI00222538E1|nr:uncharacterized protein F5J12DRAFT_905003 [Pisolithus orientalis]KAI6009388.1 hypothetical protein F5J12DRAFT_905003 [Pisolithus orientalis]